ncbi:hypothetical protein LVJ94_08670 [Pendulispora rubella]|uniref:Cytochrome c domain-containing protein n=1 Tax=Pendulispora rubella TaxID=2741070 RepID=A0ABZ2L8R2_9BACT
MKAVTSAVLLVGAAMLACACSASDAGGEQRDAGTEPDTSGSTPDFQVQPTDVYSGFDGTNTFHIPFAAYGAGADLKATVADTSVVSLEPTTFQGDSSDTGRWYMLTAKKVGTTKVTVTSGGKIKEVSVTIVGYDQSRFQAGKARYTTADGSQPACADCHAKQDGPDHSPYKLAPIPDNQVRLIITTGILDGFPIKDVEQGHRWTPNADQLAGLVTYLRALPPRGFGGTP